MSVTTKIALSVAGACVIGGLALFATALAMAGGDLASLTRSATFEERAYAVQGAAVSAIILRDENSSIRLIESPDDQIQLDYVESERGVYDFDLSSSGTLSISYRDNRRWFERIFDLSSLAGESSSVLSIPAGWLGNVALTTANASISSPGLAVLGDLSLRTSNGRVQLDRTSVGGRLMITATNSPVQLQEVQAASVTAHTTGGAVTAHEVSSVAELALRTTNSHIAVRSIAAGTAIELRTDNGRIEGTIDDDMALFGITSRASNASNSLPESRPGGPKSLHVTTTNASIDVRFLR